MSSTPIIWQKSKNFIAYPDAIHWMDHYVQQIYQHNASECLWLLEHPPLYTAGTSAKQQDLLNPGTYPTFQTNRGGKWTYHGPGQRIIYIMMDLRKTHHNFPSRDIHAFIQAIQEWLSLTLSHFGIKAETRPDRIGLWVTNNKTGKEEKIAALGFKLTHWISWHGIALNVHPNLDDFLGIVPCGLPDYDVTSLKKLGVSVSLEEIDSALYRQWIDYFGNVPNLNNAPLLHL